MSRRCHCRCVGNIQIEVLASKMAGCEQHRNIYKLHVYKQIVNCYQHLLEATRPPPQLTDNGASDITTLRKHYANIVRMLEIEHEVPAEDDEFYVHLMILRDNISQLIEERISASSQVQTQPERNPAQKENSGLKDIIQKTLVHPQVANLNHIAGHSEIKKMLTAIAILPLRQPQLYVGQKRCNSILLYGPPGTGKTQMVHALASEMSAFLFSVNSSDLLSYYVGQTEKLMKTLFETVKEPRVRPTILFMDEIDGLCKRRENHESDSNRRMKTELMCQLTDFENCPNTLLICATNCPWDLDTAFYRRLQQQIFVPLPNRSERFDILRLLTKNTPLEVTSNLWGELLCKTEGYSGSDMTNLVRHALNIPLMELTNVYMWEPLEDNAYKPAINSDGTIQNIMFRDLAEMAPGTVRARPVTVTDLLSAADVIKRTVSDLEIWKYEAFRHRT